MKVATHIPDQELRDAKIKREGVTPSADSNRRRRMADLVQYAGTCPDLMTVDELQAQRRKRVQSVDPD